MASSIAMNMSRSSSLNRKEYEDQHFRWESINKFVVLACVYSTANLDNFNMFSRVSLFEYIIFQSLVGAPYMFMDCFIKQYTKKMDGYSLLNPLLRGIQFGFFLQTALFSLIVSLVNIDLWHFFGATLSSIAEWRLCDRKLQEKCLDIEDLIYGCPSFVTKADIKTTSPHFYYTKRFASSFENERSLSIKIFSVLMVWLINFFISTVTDETFYKICRGVNWTRIISTLSLFTLTLCSTGSILFMGFGDLMNWDGDFHVIEVVKVMSFTYSIGYLSFYDYDVLSSYTITDNAVTFFSIGYNIEGVIRSLIFSTMLANLKPCVLFSKIDYDNHYILFCLLPLGGELMPVARLYSLYIYSQLLLGSTICMSMMTVSMAKLIQSEFHSVKMMYIVGLICFTGLTVSVPLSMFIDKSPREALEGIWTGQGVALHLVAFLKTTIILWFYGIKRFSKDIHYWLGFKVTKFWEVTWMILPIACLGILIKEVMYLLELEDQRTLIFAMSWVGFTVLLVAFISIKTIASFLVNNVLSKAFVASVNYGPPDPEDRSKRRTFDETLQLRRCRHNCHILDEEIDCNHLPLSNISLISINSQSLEELYSPSEQRHRTSVALTIENQ